MDIDLTKTTLPFFIQAALEINGSLQAELTYMRDTLQATLEAIESGHVDWPDVDGIDLLEDAMQNLMARYSMAAGEIMPGRTTIGSFPTGLRAELESINKRLAGGK